jgi:hypothetical protein
MYWVPLQSRTPSGTQTRGSLKLSHTPEPAAPRHSQPQSSYYSTTNLKALAASKPVQLHHLSSQVISISLIVPISPKTTARIRIINHDERLAISVLVQVTKQTHQIADAHSDSLLAWNPSYPQVGHSLLYMLVVIVLHGHIDLLGLAFLHLQQAVVHRVLDAQARHVRLFLLANTEDATEGLLFGGVVPPWVDHDDARGHGEVEAHCTRVSRGHSTILTGGDLRPPQRREASRMLTSSFLAKLLIALSRATKLIVPVY